MNTFIYLLFGLVVLYLVYYFTNKQNNPAFAAICVLLPLSLLGTYTINERKMQIEYSYHLMWVCVITLMCIILLYLTLKYTYFNSYLVTTVILIIWILSQSYKLKFWTPSKRGSSI